MLQTYTAIISRTQPTRVADLIGYQSLIIRASQHGLEGSWVLGTPENTEYGIAE